MQVKKLDTRFALAFFFSTFPILPSYFNLFGVSGVTFFTALFLLLVAISKSGILPLFSVRLTPISLPLGLWVAGQAISMLANGNLSSSITLLITTIGVWYGMSSLIDCREKFLYAIKSLIITGGAVSVLGLIESVTGFNIFSFLNTTGAQLNYNPRRFGIIRIISFSSHAIVYGLFLVFIMSLALYYLQFCKSSRERNLVKVIYLLMWINLLLTLSRSSIICAVISQLLILYFSGMRKLLMNIAKIAALTILALILLRIFYPQIIEYISNILYMMLAIFDDSYQSVISSSFGNDNLGAIGNRIDLYQWVFDRMSGNWLFGYGVENTFSYRYRATDGMFVWYNTKTSIEVQYLNSLYYYGLITVIPEILLYFTLLKESFSHRKRAGWETATSFNAVLFSTFLSYFLALFSVNRSSEYKIFYIFIGLMLIYNSHKRFEKERENFA